MMGKQVGITIDPVGIADILQRWSLAVPLNQCPYAWEEDNIERLFYDLAKAFDTQPLLFHGHRDVHTRREGRRLRLLMGNNGSQPFQC